MVAMCWETRRLYSIPALFELFADDSRGLGGMVALEEANRGLAIVRYGEVLDNGHREVLREQAKRAAEGTVDVTVFTLRSSFGPLSVAVNPIVFGCTFVPGASFVFTLTVVVCFLVVYSRVVATKQYVFDMVELYHNALVTLVRADRGCETELPKLRGIIRILRDRLT